MKLKYTIAAIAATTLAANAATVVSYNSGVAAAVGTGAADPTGQGWAASTGSPGSYNYGADSTIGGWRITDGTGNAAFFYQAGISASDATAMNTGDWTATWTATINHDAVSSAGVPNGVNNYYNTSLQNNNAMWIELNGGAWYVLTYGDDGSGNTTLSDGTTTYNIGTVQSEELSGTSVTHVTYTLSSVGGAVTLSDSVNGTHATAVTSIGTGATDRVVWGATSSGGQGSTTWNAISVDTVPEPSSTALIGLGGLALILRRRK